MRLQRLKIHETIFDLLFILHTWYHWKFDNFMHQPLLHTAWLMKRTNEIILLVASVRKFEELPVWSVSLEFKCSFSSSYLISFFTIIINLHSNCSVFHNFFADSNGSVSIPLEHGSEIWILDINRMWVGMWSILDNRDWMRVGDSSESWNWNCISFWMELYHRWEKANDATRFLP